MSGLHRRSFASNTITTKTLISIIFSLIVAGSICTLLIFPRALAAPIVSDNFNDNSLDTAKWDTNLFSGFTNTSVPLAETAQRLEIGPLLQNVAGSSYRGIRTVSSFNFSNSYSFVELVQAPASNTAADAMFTIGNDVNAYYRIYVSAGNLIGLRKIGATKTTLFSIPYDTVNHRFLRIRHNSGNVTLDTAPGSGGVPGTWVQRFTEAWHSSISTSSIIFEVKGGTWQVEANAPGKVIFDNFEAATNSAAAPTVSAISPTSGTTSGGTSVTITGTGFSAGASVSLGGTAATNVTVVSSTSITATTPAHAAGAVNVVVTNTDSQSGTLNSGYTYSAAPDTVLVSDDFNDNSLDTAKWDTNLFSGFTNTSVPLAETSQRLEIGPLLQNVAGSSYRGIRTVSSFNFNGAYSYVELVQAAASNTAADAMFTIGNDVNAYYRIYVSAGNLIGLRKIGATKTTLFSISYDTVNHRFLRIRHDATTGNVTLDTAPGSGGVPGTWVQRFTESWHSSISTSSIIFEVKGGTWQVEANAPGKVIFDNFLVAVPASSPSVSLKMVAANLQHGQSTDGTFHYDQQANNITATSDLVAAQEVSVGDIPNWDTAFTAGGFTRVKSKMHLNGGDGNAIWAKSTLTVNQTYEHDLANGVNPTSGSSVFGYDGSSDIRRSVVAAKFTFNSKQFYVVSVHLCPSICRDNSGTTESVQRVTQIQDLLSWVDSTLTGGLPVILMGDLNLTIDTPKQPSGFQFDLFTQAGFSDLWQTGLSNSVAEANWGDRDGDSVPDMPLGLQTRTHDSRRIDYVLYEANSGSITLVKISVPDGRAQCPQALVTGGNYKQCPSVTQLWDFPEDQGVRLSDHNWLLVELGF